MMYEQDTISAVATALGEGGIGIVRLSGPKAIEFVQKFFVRPSGKPWPSLPSHQVLYGYLLNEEQEKVDEVIVLIMKGPRSYTREDVVEIHCHGGTAVIKRILSLTLRQGARLAEPGEFTKRAFLNGRLDLSQAEAVIDVIRAKTDASLRVAMGQLGGNLSQTIKTMRQGLLEMIAHLEVTIDYPEEDIEEMTAQEVQSKIKGLQKQITDLLASAKTGRILREGLKTVIVGKPNVGKSSLMNALLRENRAIVTAIPGTTRDVIEETVNIEGFPLTLLDTAGIRTTGDEVEKIGVEKSRQLIDQADLILLLLDISRPFDEEDKEIIELLQNKNVLIVFNKSDLPTQLNQALVLQELPGQDSITVSLEQEQGVKELEAILVQKIQGGAVVTEATYVTQVRHIDLLEQSETHLSEANTAINAGFPPDCIVTDLREAWETLGFITGDSIQQDLVNQIFHQFCVGK